MSITDAMRDGPIGMAESGVPPRAADTRSRSIRGMRTRPPFPGPLAVRVDALADGVQNGSTDLQGRQ